jgi:hypothetical protein
MNGFRLTLGVFRLNACMRAFCLNPCWPRFENVFFFFSFHTAAALRGSRHGAAGARNKIKKREKMFDCMVEGCGRRQI